ncbi:formyltetrahydrofolate deformylase [Tistrella mobilis]|uniref:Formyltetrahydrofolate deformylase n=1 Tax=Tistrella mobilis (strain KA081020-065) TaxID=1110502 RepID=I3TWN5_TISMK|nr:formyltetrahydrofolate deformylase [Tistrella mobilis]AFK57173.1 formyltetrahydrofolate deformylase [Tistrella mobilis KA081020-065]MAM74633.1 formyltetrahydrofolate deformylase [Tistrella sp.]
MPVPSPTHVLTITCPDIVGLVAAVSGFLSGEGVFINESAQYGDPETQTFFMRVVLSVPGDGDGALGVRFAEVARRFAMRWTLHDLRRRPRVLICVTKAGHCLNDLLHRWHSGLLPIEVAGVMGNHDSLRHLADWHNVPFHHLPVTAATKADQERALLDLIRTLDVELVVLARYMQILSPTLCQALSGRCINIHHSFLPGFKGARPYHQAHARGVKLIGATAHYVTTDLDEGPIIEQAVERVDHTHTAEELVTIGRDIETVVLARAVQWHVERRVLINHHKTVVFR